MSKLWLLGLMGLVGSATAAAAAPYPAQELTVGFQAGTQLTPEAYGALKEFAARVSRECWQDAVKYRLDGPRCWVTVGGYSEAPHKAPGIAEERAQAVAWVFEVEGIPASNITSVDLSDVKGSLQAPAATAWVKWVVEPPRVQRVALAKLSPAPIAADGAQKPASGSGPGPGSPVPGNGLAKAAAHSPVMQDVGIPVNRDELPSCLPAHAGHTHWCVPFNLSRPWTLTAHRTIRQELEAWAKESGWTVVWQSSSDWTVPATTTVHGQFESAAAWVFRQLAASGVLLRAKFYEGNNTLVVNDVSAS
jgi:hypothetical protein